MLLSRSRMPGVMGLTVDFRDLGPDDVRRFATEFAEYKNLRGMRGTSYGIALTLPVEN